VTSSRNRHRLIALEISTSGETIEIDLEEKCRCCLSEFDNSQCLECHGTGIAMTINGEKIIEFVRRWVMRGDE